MGESLRLAVGIMGNAASILLYSVPILTFARIIKKGSTQGFSCVPYVLALLNCLLFTWYGLPVVSHGWENFLVVSTNGIGIVLEFSFIVIYFWFVSAKGKEIKVSTIPLLRRSLEVGGRRMCLLTTGSLLKSPKVGDSGKGSRVCKEVKNKWVSDEWELRSMAATMKVESAGQSKVDCVVPSRVVLSLLIFKYALKVDGGAG